MGLPRQGRFRFQKSFFLWKLNRTAKKCRGEFYIALVLAATPNCCGSSRYEEQDKFLWRKESAALIRLG